MVTSYSVAGINLLFIFGITELINMFLDILKTRVPLPTIYSNVGHSEAMGLRRSIDQTTTLLDPLRMDSGQLCPFNDSHSNVFSWMHVSKFQQGYFVSSSKCTN